METRRHTNRPGLAKRVACGVGGGLCSSSVSCCSCARPGPAAGARRPARTGQRLPQRAEVRRPVERRAMKAAEESVASPLRMVFSIGTGVVLIAAGVVWWVVPGLPLGGWPTGCSLILSGLILLGVLVVSYRRVRSQREAGSEPTTPPTEPAYRRHASRPLGPAQPSAGVPRLPTSAVPSAFRAVTTTSSHVCPEQLPSGRPRRRGPARSTRARRSSPHRARPRNRRPVDRWWGCAARTAGHGAGRPPCARGHRPERQFPVGEGAPRSR